MDLAWRLIFCIAIGSLLVILHKWIGRYPLPFPKSDHPIGEISTVLLLWSLAVILPILKIFVLTPRLNNFIDARFLLELFYLPVNAVIYVAIPLFFVVRRDKWSATDLGLTLRVKSWSVVLFALILALTSGFTAFISNQAVIGSDPLSAGTLIILLFNNDFMEEFFHRGIIQSKLERAIGQNKAIFFGGILFGMTHIAFDIYNLADTGVLFVIFAFVLQVMLGWLLGIIYMKTRSLWPGVTFHYLVNWLPSILVGLFG